METQNLVTERQRFLELKRLDARARRAAKRVGLIARKSRWRVGTADNCGGFMVIDPFTNIPVCGWRFDLEPEEVIEFAEADNESEEASSEQEAI